MLEIIKPIQKEYEQSSIANNIKDTTCEICGYYGRACRTRIGSVIGKWGCRPSIFSAGCGFSLGGSCCPIQKLFAQKYKPEAARHPLYRIYGAEAVLYNEDGSVKDNVY